MAKNSPRRPPPLGDLKAYRIRREDKAQMQTALVALESAAGSKIAEIAKSFDLPESRVKQMLSLAEEHGFIEHFRRVGYERLMAKAWAVYDFHLDQGNLAAARDIALGLKVMEPANAGKDLRAKAIDTLDAYRERRRKALAQPQTIDVEGTPDASKLERSH